MTSGPAGDQSGLRRITHTGLGDEVYERLKALLIDNTFPPDTRLTTDFLANSLGVSRTPVRESLARLEVEGLLVKRPMAGYSVSPPLDRRGLEELFEVRLLLEPAAAMLAAVKITSSQLADIHPQLVPAAPTTVSGYDDYRAFVAADALFHDQVAVASGNSRLRESIRRLYAHLHTYRLWAQRAATTIESMTEHARVARTLAEHDAAGAEQAMRDHLEGSLARLFAALTDEP
jgi:DNA-binding GntR family transcriptional regulator